MTSASKTKELSPNPYTLIFVLVFHPSLPLNDPTLPIPFAWSSDTQYKMCPHSVNVCMQFLQRGNYRGSPVRLPNLSRSPRVAGNSSM
jgi:hypothetical protein